MKPLRFFLRSGSAALLCFLAFSCIDETYDIKKANYDAEILKEGISLPLASIETSMDSLLKGVSSMTVKNNMYTISTTSSMDMSALTSTMTDFVLTKPSDVITNVSLYNAPNEQYDAPQGFYSSFNSTSTLSLPNFTTDLIAVSAIKLKNTTFTMKATTSANLQGTNRDNSILITCTPADNVAEYYINNTKVTHWSMKANEEKVIEIRYLNLASSKTLQIDYSIEMNVATTGAIKITSPTQSSISVSAIFNGIDFETVYGKITYSKSESTTASFKGLGDILSNNNVLSFYNPTIKLKWTENLGVPVNLTLNMSSRNTVTLDTARLTNTTFTLQAAPTTTSSVTDSFVIDRDNNTSNLFKINPNQLTTGYTIQADPNTSNHFINKNTNLSMESTLEIPLQFGSDLQLNLGDTIDNPFLDALDQLDDQDSLSFAFLFDVINRIPLGIQIKLTGLSSSNVHLFDVQTSTISPAKGINVTTGFASDTTMTSTELSFTKTQINQFKNALKFKIDFVVTASNTGNAFVTIQPSDYIKIKIGASIKGGVLLDLNKKTE
jgi:hypothetical protein